MKRRPRDPRHPRPPFHYHRLSLRVPSTVTSMCGLYRSVFNASMFGINLRRQRPFWRTTGKPSAMDAGPSAGSTLVALETEASGPSTGFP